jgi:hypothetical protein
VFPEIIGAEASINAIKIRDYQASKVETAVTESFNFKLTQELTFLWLVA